MWHCILDYAWVTKLIHPFWGDLNIFLKGCAYALMPEKYVLKKKMRLNLRVDHLSQRLGGRRPTSGSVSSPGASACLVSWKAKFYSDLLSSFKLFPAPNPVVSPLWQSYKWTVLVCLSKRTEERLCSQHGWCVCSETSCIHLWRVRVLIHTLL